MIRSIALIRTASLLAALLAASVGGVSVAQAQAAPEQKADNTVREPVAAPLRKAQDFIKEKKYAEALEQIKLTDAVADKTPYEVYVIERMRASSASNLGQDGVAQGAVERALASGHTPKEDVPTFYSFLMKSHYDAKNYKASAQWANKVLALNPEDLKNRLALAQAYYFDKDYANSAAQLNDLYARQMKAGVKPDKRQFELLFSCGALSKDNAVETQALDLLLRYYPERKYWFDRILRIERTPGYADRLSIDVFRLQAAADAIDDGEDWVVYAELAQRAALPTEAQQAMKKGFAAGLLGTGDKADKHRKLQASIDKQAADDVKTLAQSEALAEKNPDGFALFNVGLAWVGADQAERGLALMEKALAKGVSRNPADARLRLGAWYARAGQKDKALALLDGVVTAGAKDGSVDIASLWKILLK